MLTEWWICCYGGYRIADCCVQTQWPSCISYAACRLCRRIEKQQQLHQKQQEDLVQAQKQQYIEFMTEMRQQKSGPDPTSPSQAQTRCTNGECLLPLSWTGGDAHDDHQQLPQQVQQQAPQLREAQLSGSQIPCEARTSAVQTPSALHHGRHAR